MTPKLFRSDETRQWLRYAQEDLAGAEVLTSAHPPLLKLALFHCQQAVEKALKAFLVWHEQPFTKTHNLVPLGDQSVALDPTLDAVVAPALQLTRYAVRLRYPGEPEEPTVEEAKQWLVIARSALDEILQRLPEEVKGGP